MRAALLLLPCLALPCAAVLAGCDLTMSDQARHETAAGDRLWRGGPRDLPPPAGTVAQSTPALVAAASAPPPLTHEVVERGRDRYEIYCTPCHGSDGAGNGPVVQRGFPRPHDLVAPDQRALGADALFRVIGDGSGVMYGFSDRVGPQDRWAIVAYVRALQLSRGGTPSPSPARAEETRRFGGRT